MKNLNFVLILLMFFCIATSSAQSSYKVVNKIHLEGNGGWDYITLDEAASRLYVSHGNEVQVVDVTNDKLIGTIPDTKGVHGITLAGELGKGFISNGRDTSVTIFNLKTLKLIAKVKVTGNNPDGILYDPFSHRVFTFNGRSSNSTVIDARTNKVIGTIALAGKPEFPVSNLKGKIFVNIEDKNSISVINANTLKVEKNWPIAPGESPSGLAIDLKNNRLFAVCDNKLMTVVNCETGKVVATLKIGESCDGVSFDSVLKRIYSSNGEGTLTVVQEKDANTFTVLENFPTQKGARTITANSKTHKLYLPTAEYNEAPAATAQNPHPRASVKPGTFTVLEVGLK
ncbi:MAG: YncE family protein [Bacteroidota bacterium]|nr:YncE family protein [Bacteroidota bacterium]